MNRPVDRTQEAPEGRGGTVAQGGALAAGEDSGHPAPVPARSSVSHGVDAAVDVVETTDLQTSRDRTFVESCAVKLLNGDRTVLPCSDHRHR
jgi:hypothetical protein